MTNISKHEGNSIRDVPDLDKYILRALRQHNVKRENLRICLLFGSYARGYARPESDVDLLLFVREMPGKPTFSYQRFRFGSVVVDSNLIKFSNLDFLCQPQTWNWAYRLYKSFPVFDFCNENPSKIVEWLQILDALIESEEACYNRAESHIADLAYSYELLSKCNDSFPFLQFYITTEICRLVPMAILNICGKVPYTKYHPEETDIEFPEGLNTSLENLYNRFLFDLAKMKVSRSPVNKILLGLSARKIRHQIHQEIEKKWPNNVGKGYDGLLKREWAEICELDDFLADSGLPGVIVTIAFKNVLVALISELGKLSTKRISSSEDILKGLRGDIAIHKDSGSRLIRYDQNRKRLKGIIPTGGCRVGTCTFCMLPFLSRSKMDVNNFIKEMREHISGPVEKVAIYTDGSFFDDRELNNEERLQIAEEVSGLGANELLIETLPRFLSSEKVSKLIRSLSPSCKLRIGVGIQSMTDEVRKYVTRTPITNSELQFLFSLRKQVQFDLRVFLLAGKCYMSRFEDLEDLKFSMQALKDLLDPSDVVTINPLLPTEGTLVYSLQNKGYFRPMSKADACQMAIALTRSAWPFKLEFGPLSASTCTNQAVKSDGVNEYPYISLGDIGPSNKEGSYNGKAYDYELGPALIPWVLLGDLQRRANWASKLFMA